MVVALVEAYARKLKTPVDECWAYLDRRKAPPQEWRDSVVAAFFPRVPPDSFLGLTTPHIPSTVDDVTPAPSSNALRSQKLFSSGAAKSKFVQIITKKGVTFAEVADALETRLKRKVPRSTVQSWAKPKDDPSYRAIPQDAAEALKSLYGVPMNAWARVIPAP